MPRYSNGRIPDSALVTLDTGGGRHLTTPTAAVRWYLLRRNVKARTGVTLYITPGMNAYRDWDEQGVGRRNACAQGNCNAAASQGYSSHGGTWLYGGRWVDAMAFDIGNYWAIPWAIFVEEAARVGLRTGLITRAIAGIEEPWHVIDLDPFGPPPGGLTLTKGADGVWRLEEDMPLDANADYEAFKTMLQRALRFDVRPNGAGADHKLGPTLWERLDAAVRAGNEARDAAKAIVVDVDETALAGAIGKLPVTLGADALAAIAKAAADGAKSGGEAGARAAIAGLTFVVSHAS